MDSFFGIRLKLARSPEVNVEDKVGVDGGGMPCVVKS